MSYSYDVAYVLKNEDYLSSRKELDSDSIEFISFAERSELFTSTVCTANRLGESEELLILLYWKEVNHWGSGRTSHLAQKLNETIHDHIIIGEDMGDVECHAGLGSGTLSVKSEVLITIPESDIKENLLKLFTHSTD